MKGIQYWLIVTCSVLAVGCGSKETFEPKRPNGLPQNAMYAGGIDGGEWVSCTPTSDNRLVCVIFDSTTGDPRYEKSLKICPSMLLVVERTRKDLRPRYLDAEIAQFDGAPAFVDRPFKYYPRPADSHDEIERQEELSRKYYEDYGVTEECKAVNPNPGTWD